jgi:hypothetical protein
MKVIVKEDRSPIAVSMVWYRAGAWMKSAAAPASRTSSNT